MWITVNTWMGNDREAVDTLRHILGGDKITCGDFRKDGKCETEMCVNVVPTDFPVIWKYFDVMLMDRHGKDYMMLDKKNKRFSVR
jgi:hypothetical protein